MVGLVPAHARTAGCSVAQAVAAAVLGGLAPAVCTWLNHTFDSNAMVGVWLGLNALLSLAAVWTLDHKQTAINQQVELH